MVTRKSSKLTSTKILSSTDRITVDAPPPANTNRVNGSQQGLHTPVDCIGQSQQLTHYRHHPVAVSTPTGVISHFVNLQVVVPEAFILGSGELHVDMGSTINLVCIIEKSPQPPQYVYWQRNDRMINYDDSRRDISIETVPGQRTQSRLIIREPQINDSGNYTCSASNTEPASIYVFVSKGELCDMNVLLHRAM
nr:hemicentin-1-like [Aedes albopictus]